MTMTITMIAYPVSSPYTEAPHGVRDASGWKEMVDSKQHCCGGGDASGCSEPRIFRSPVQPSRCTGPVLDNPPRSTDCESTNHRLQLPTKTRTSVHPTDVWDHCWNWFMRPSIHQSCAKSRILFKATIIQATIKRFRISSCNNCGAHS